MVQSGQPAQTGQPDGTIQLPGYMSLAAQAGAKKLGAPTNVKQVAVGNKLVSIGPTGQMSVTQVGDTPIQEAVAKATGKAVGDLYTARQSLANMEPNLSVLDDVLGQPALMSMKDHPEYAGLDVPFFKYLGEPAQQRVLSNLTNASGTLQQELSSLYKGPAKGFIMKTIRDTKVDKSDPLPVMVGKQEMMQAVHKYLADLNDMETYLIENKSVPYGQALKIASKALDPRKYIQESRSKYDGIINRYKTRQAALNQSKGGNLMQRKGKNASNNRFGMVRVYDNKLKKVVFIPQAEYDKDQGGQ